MRVTPGFCTDSFPSLTEREGTVFRQDTEPANVGLSARHPSKCEAGVRYTGLAPEKSALRLGAQITFRAMATLRTELDVTTTTGTCLGHAPQPPWRSLYNSQGPDECQYTEGMREYMVGLLGGEIRVRSEFPAPECLATFWHLSGTEDEEQRTRL